MLLFYHYLFVHFILSLASGLLAFVEPYLLSSCYDCYSDLTVFVSSFFFLHFFFLAFH